MQIRYSKFFLLISFIAMCSSCMIMINENDYRGLTTKDKLNYLPYTNEVWTSNSRNEELKVFEIDSEQIKSIAEKNDYTWVHLWRPYCKAEYCENIGYFQEIKEKHTDLTFLLVSENYHFSSIKEIAEHSAYELPIFVLRDSYYGHKQRKNRKKLETDLTGNEQDVSDHGYGDYVFYLGKLIYSGNNLLEPELDSIINAN